MRLNQVQDSRKVMEGKQAFGETEDIMGKVADVGNLREVRRRIPSRCLTGRSSSPKPQKCPTIWNCHSITAHLDCVQTQDST